MHFKLKNACELQRIPFWTLFKRINAGYIREDFIHSLATTFGPPVLLQIGFHHGCHNAGLVLTPGTAVSVTIVV